jgi:hypothetical protein
MKIALAFLLAFAGMAAAQEEDSVPAKRVESVTWDLQAHKLVWVVKNGVQRNGEFVPSSEERYEITPERGMMAFDGHERGFTDQEALWLQHLLDVLTIYCAESVIWWAQGDDTPAVNPDAPATKPEPPASKPRKVAESRRVPGAVVLVARNRIQ